MARHRLSAKAHRDTDRLGKLNAEFKRFYGAGMYGKALEIATQMRKLTPDPAVVFNHVACLFWLERYQECHALLRGLTAQADTIKFNELMAEVCNALERFDEARHYGSKALRLKDEAVAAEARHALPAQTPPPFDGRDPSCNIIAYSLFGNSPRYCEVAIMNCLAIARLLPGWRCRFYCDGSVPPSIRQRLTEAGGEVTLLADHQLDGLHPLMWRFLVADDPHVARFLIRDADSLVGEREAAAVDAWLRSDKWFHLIRDWPNHCELLLAGMWGGCTGVISDMRGEIRVFLEKGGYAASHVDQEFLRKRIWPTVRESVLSHDGQFAFFNNEPLPVVEGAAYGRYDHIGGNLSPVSIKGERNAPDGTVATWTLCDEQGRAVCSYESVIAGGRWEAAIPRSYAENIAAGRWSIVTR